MKIMWNLSNMDSLEKILLSFLALIIFSFIGITIYQGTRECLSGHYETQYEAPISIVVGGNSKGNFGGVGIPVGNIKPVEVFVCDEYDK